MNNKQKLILILFVFLLSGCSVKYDILVDEKKQVTENVTLNVPKDKYCVNETDKKDCLNSAIKNYQSIDEYKKYKFDYVIKNGDVTIDISKKYGSLELYKDSQFLNQLFESTNILKSEEYVTFQTVGKYYYNSFFSKDQLDPELIVEKIEIRVKFYNEVVENNADYIDKKNNVYIWKMDNKLKERNIQFKINNKVKYDIIIKDFINRNIYYILVGVIILVVLIILTISFIIRFRKNNKI